MFSLDVKSRNYDLLVVLVFVTSFIFSITHQFFAAPLAFILGWYLVYRQEKVLKAEASPTGIQFAGFWIRSASLLIDMGFFFFVLLAIQHAIGDLVYDYNVCGFYSLAFLLFDFFLMKRWNQSLGKMALGIKVMKSDYSTIGWKEIILRDTLDILSNAWEFLRAGLILVGLIAVNLIWVPSNMTPGPFKNWPEIITRDLSFLYLIWGSSEVVILLTNHRKRALHDFLAGTVVVIDQELKLGRKMLIALLCFASMALGYYWYRNTSGKITEYYAERGVAEDQVHLGFSYHMGNFGMYKDDTLALIWFHKAADQGNAEAQFYIGKMYETGDGVPQDQSEANRWFTLAAQNGYLKAEKELKEVNDPKHDRLLGYEFYKGEFETLDYTKALYWLQKAAAEGDGNACFDLGQMYEKGLGVPQDIDKAKGWYTQGATRGDGASKWALKRLSGK